MECRQGKAIFHGIAIGRLSVYGKERQPVKREKIEAPEAEKKRYFEARDHAVEELHQIYEKAVQEVGELHAQKMCIRDSLGIYRFPVYEDFPGSQIIELRQTV